MTSMSSNSVLIEIKPWQAALYDQMRRPMTIAGVKRKLKDAERDLRTARAVNDIAAVKGAEAALRLLLLETIAVDVGGKRDADKKATLLHTFAEFWKGTPLFDIAVQSAIGNVAFASR